MTRTNSKVMKFGFVGFVGIAATLSHYAVMFAGLAGAGRVVLLPAW